jgi:hypothetical protein
MKNNDAEFVSIVRTDACLRLPACPYVNRRPP